LKRLSRDLESNRRPAAEKSVSGSGRTRFPQAKSVAVLYFENQSGGERDEILPRWDYGRHRHGDFEDSAMESFRARRCWHSATSRHGAASWASSSAPAYVLEVLFARAEPRADHRTAGGSLDKHSVWAERYDRQLEDVFAIQKKSPGASPRLCSSR